MPPVLFYKYVSASVNMSSMSFVNELLVPAVARYSRSDSPQTKKELERRIIALSADLAQLSDLLKDQTEEIADFVSTLHADRDCRSPAERIAAFLESIHLSRNFSFRKNLSRY